LPHRDAVVIELRGLRYSKPNLISNELVKARYEMMDKNLNEEEIMAIQIKALQETRDRLQSEGVNLSAFNNVETAADIAMIMTNLGYEKFSLFGSSAGTLVAQHVIRDYPEMVNCAILNGSVPIGTPFGRDMVPEAINSLKRIFNLCKEDADCSKAYPLLEERFLNFLDSINQSPITIPIEVEGEEEKLNYVLNGSRFAGMVMLYMYFNPNVHDIIDQIMNGNYEFVNLVVGFQSTMSTFADILGYSVFLSECPVFSLSDIQIDPAYSEFSKGVTSMGLGGEFLLAVDSVFTIDKIDPEIIRPDDSYNVPILVLNGKYDPVIPESYDEVLYTRFDRSYIYRFDGIAHSPVDFAEACAIKMFFEFIDDPSKRPEDLCVDEYFFTLLMK
jgi:pimeloyl-ACP methyl ester carboxylesterase